MIALVMAGGRGSRMKADTEKLLMGHKKPAILCVVDALRDSGCFESVFAATSPNAPRTRRLLEGHRVPIIETVGDGYARDLNRALGGLTGAVLAVSGDMPLLDASVIRRIVSRYSPVHGWTSYIVTGDFLDSLGLTCEFGLIHGGIRCVYTGISVIDADRIASLDSVEEHYEVINDRRIAFNMNTKREYDLLDAAGAFSV